jgi:hypothetical protein
VPLWLPEKVKRLVAPLAPAVAGENKVNEPSETIAVSATTTAPRRFQLAREYCLKSNMGILLQLEH